MKRADCRRWALTGALLGACGGGQGAAEPAAPPAEGPAAAEEPAAAGPARERSTTAPRGPEGAELVRTVQPPAGFIDTPLAFDGAGGRLLYVNSDAAELCELVVFDLGSERELARISLNRFTTAPLAVDDVDGERFLVFARPSPDSAEISAAIIDRTGALVRVHGPATDVVRTTYDGHDALAVYRRAEIAPRAGKKAGHKPAGKPAVVHSVDVFALDSGKRLGKPARLTTDLAGFSEKLDFRINHWSRGYTVAVGIKGGEYDRREDQRSPDVEAWLDVPRAAFIRRTPIAEVIEHTRRMQFLAAHPNRDRFVAAAPDLRALVLSAEGSAPAPVQLPEPFRHYRHDSLVVQDAPADRPLYFTLEIDPVHPDAAEQRRAVERWLDLFEVAPGETRAVRRARLPVEEGQPGVRWRAAAGTWAVVPRHVGFERGGPALHLYRLKGE